MLKLNPVTNPDRHNACMYDIEIKLTLCSKSMLVRSLYSSKECREAINVLSSM